MTKKSKTPVENTEPKTRRRRTRDADVQMDEKKSDGSMMETAKSTRSSGASSSGGGRNIFGSILAGLGMIVAFVVFAITGVDLSGGQLSNNSTTQLPPDVVLTAVPDLGNAPIGNEQSRVINLPFATGVSRDFWRIYFTVPSPSIARGQWAGGIEDELVTAINQTQRTLDIAAFEWESTKMTNAVLSAFNRGVAVRMVLDDEHAFESEDSTLAPLIEAGIPMVNDARSGFMHNKFMVIDGIIVWTGSMNYQPNDLFRNNNNVIVLRSRQAAEVYTAEFNEMFDLKRFGKTSPRENTANFNQNGTNIQVYYASENEVMPVIINEVNQAQQSIRFMSFSFTDFDLAQAMLTRSQAGVGVSGVFETVGSQTEASEMTYLFCNGVTVFQDGNPGILHNKVIIIDGQTVISGSFNFSSNAVNSNDENVVIIKNREIAQLYLAEWERIRSIARVPTKVNCGDSG
jgi:phosphatidylserine/phosphatidylglycerophosphate/cardiolipin synthase-like enzyme